MHKKKPELQVGDYATCQSLVVYLFCKDWIKQNAATCAKRVLGIFKEYEQC